MRYCRLQSNNQIYIRFLKTKAVYQWIDSSTISDSRWRLPTNKPVWVSYSTDQKNSTGHMFNTKLGEKSYKMSLKALPVKLNRSKNWQGEHNVPPSGPDRVKNDIARGRHEMWNWFFLNFLGSFFSKYTFLRLQSFILASIKYSINSIFSVVVCICKIHVFN